MGGNWIPPENIQQGASEPPDLDAWLESECNGPEAGGGRRTVKTIDLIAELIGVNGGLDVHGWGMISYGGGPWGRMGLDQEEALLLRFFDGVLTGVRLTDPAKGQEIVNRLMEITKAEMRKAGMTVEDDD